MNLRKKVRHKKEENERSRKGREEERNGDR
jgi:hypothetical protein